MSQVSFLDAIELFNEALKPVGERIRLYKTNTELYPHNLSHQERQEIELLHYELTTLLYRLRYGELDERLKRQDINFDQHAKESNEIRETRDPYVII
ncbi:MAG: hypothetical protein HPY50_08835 [Firmicutes bacterium]|nr:hypothetical protein [Bacillota bacterium]